MFRIRTLSKRIYGLISLSKRRIKEWFQIRELPTDDLNFLVDSFKGRVSTDMDADELVRRLETDEFTENEYYQLHCIIRGMENEQ